MSDDRDHQVAKAVGTVAANVALAAIGAPLSVGFGGGKDTWDPVVPADMRTSKLPPVAEDGTVECWMCKTRLPFANVNVANEAYVCGPCTLAKAKATAPALPDDVKLGRPMGGTLLLIGAALAIAAVIIVFYKFA